MIVILLGSPGSGKGTQSKRLSQALSFEHLSTGDIFRAEISQKTPLGLKAGEYVKSGKLVPDEIVTEMVAGRLEPGGRYLLDGFPRTLEQAQGLSRILAQGGASVGLVVYLTLPRAEAIARMASRRVCSSCGEVYNVRSRPPRAEGSCDRCAGPVVQREDDTEATAARRLMVFEDLTQPLVAYYRAEQLLAEIDASRAPDAVEADLRALIGKAVPAAR